MASPQGPTSAALSRSQQPWAPNPPSRPPLTAVASLGKGHGAGFVAAGTAVGVGEGSEAQERGGEPHTWQQPELGYTSGPPSPPLQHGAETGGKSGAQAASLQTRPQDTGSTSSRVRERRRDWRWGVGSTRVLGLQGSQPLRGSGGDGCEWRRPAELFLFFFSALLSFEGYPVTPTAGPRGKPRTEGQRAAPGGRGEGGKVTKGAGPGVQQTPEDTPK